MKRPTYQAKVQGTITEPLRLDRNLYAEKVYTMTVKAKGEEVAIRVHQHIVPDFKLEAGDHITVVGDLRMSKQDQTLCIYARSIASNGKGKSMSSVWLQGSLYDMPRYNRKHKVYKAYIAVTRQFNHSDIVLLVISKDMTQRLREREIGALVILQGAITKRSIKVDKLATHYQEALQAGG